MITFQKIKWKNLLSTGNHWTEVDFQSSPTNLVIGTNGAGKSTILDALTFVLFNKPFRKVNKSQLVNAVNERECQVEIDDFVAMRACEMHDYMYNIIRPDDIVVPPKNDLFQKDKMA